jgi:hypothetical protein
MDKLIAAVVLIVLCFVIFFVIRADIKKRDSIK